MTDKTDSDEFVLSPPVSRGLGLCTPEKQAEIRLKWALNAERERDEALARVKELEGRIACARELAQAEMDQHMDVGRFFPFTIQQALDGKLKL